jgi:hypothetical protein
MSHTGISECVRRISFKLHDNMHNNLKLFSGWWLFSIRFLCQLKQVRKCTHGVTILARSPECDLYKWRRIPRIGIPNPVTSPQKNACRSSCEVPVIAPILTKIKMCRQISAKLPNIKFREIPFSDYRNVTCTQTVRKILMGASQSCVRP